MMKNKFIKICIISTLLVLFGCADTLKPNAGHPAIRDIYKAFDEGIVDDQQKGEVLPAKLAESLLPDLAFDKPGKKTEKTKFDLSVTDVEARTFFLGLVKDTPYNIVVSPEVTGTISLDLKNVSVEDVLDTVRSVYGYDFVKTAYGYQVLPGGVQTRMFSVNYINVERSSESQILISSGQITQNFTPDNSDNNTTTTTTSNQPGGNVTPSAKITTKATTNFWGSLQTTLETMLADKPGRKVIINPQAGIVIVRAHTLELDQVGEYLDSLENTMTRQVLLEAKIVEVKLSDAYQSGIDWKLLGLSQTGIRTLPFKDDTGSAGDELDSFTAIFKANAKIGTSFSSVIELLSTQGNVQVLSNPRISTLNNQKAVIKVGFDEFFITNVSNTNTTTGGTVGEQTQDLELTPFFSGIALDVTPRISSDGKVILHIHPIVSDVYDQTKTFTVSGQEQSLPLALSVIRESDSIVEAGNGQVIVIGGLMETKTRETLGSTPFLSKVPYAGTVFRKTNQLAVKTELVILLKPTIIDKNAWTAKLKEDRETLRSMDRGYHFGDHPNTFGNLGEWEKMKGGHYVP